jgi:ZIP family zinc transporter
MGAAPIMNEFLLVLGIASITAFLTFLGALLAEKVEAPRQVMSAALQLAAGSIIAVVAFTLMPPAVQSAPPLLSMAAFFVGGALFVVMDYVSASRQSSQPTAAGGSNSLGLYLGVLTDMAIDGVAIGIGSAVTLGTGLIVAAGLAVNNVPLAFLTIATARRQGMPLQQRRLLSLAFIGFILAGAMLGYWVLNGQSDLVQSALVALVSGFLITMVSLTMIPEAHQQSAARSLGLFFIGGLSLFAFLALI